jgi:autotransporter-associated beta strand protein
VEAAASEIDTMQHGAPSAARFDHIGDHQALNTSRLSLVARLVAYTPIVVTLIAGVWTPQPAAAAISIVDNAITPIADGTSPTQFTISSFTVSPTADVLIVEIGTRGVSGSANTITYGGQTLTLSVQQPSVNTVFRDSAIYYLYNPTPGTAALSGQFSPTGISDYVLSGFTLSGVNTSIAPITTSADGAGNATVTATLTAAQAASVLPGSFAAMEQTLNSGTGPFTYSATASGSTSGAAAQQWQGTSGVNILASGGIVSGLSAGTDSYTASLVMNGNTKNPLAVAVFTPIASFVWIGGTSSDWATGMNWQIGSAPNGTGQTATFGNASSNPSIALASAGEVVGGITFSGSVNATVNGPNMLSLDNGVATASIVVNGGTNAINAPIALNSSVSISAVVGSQLTIGGSIAESGGAKSLAFSGPGTLVLSAANTFSGEATISSGTLCAGNANSLQNSTVAINSDNGLAFGAGVGAFTLGGLAGTGAISLEDSASSPVAVNVGGNGASTNFSGPLSGSGSLNKVGGGTLALSATNTYQGATTVSGGTLQLVGASGNNIPNSPTISVNSGAILDVTGLAGGSLTIGLSTAQILTGHGTINGAVTVSSGSTIAAALGGPLTIAGRLTLQGGSMSSFTLGAPNGSGNPSAAFINVTGGTFGVSGTHIVNLSGAAQTGTYELFAFTNGAPSAGQFSLGTTAGKFLYAFNVVANSEVDLVVSPRIGSATWNLDGNGNYSDFGKWSPTVVPNGASLTATFGNGGSNSVGSSPALTVLVDAPATAGSLVFNNTNGTSYIVGNDFVTGHSLTLDNGGSGASIAVGATAPQQIQANLVLADIATFNIAPTSSLLVTVGSMSETGGSRSITLSGGGTLTIDTPSGYTGGTTVTGGTLTTTPTGTIGNGPLSLTASGGAAATVNLGNDQTVSSLSGTVSGGGTATVRVGAGTTLSVNQSTASTYVGTIALESSANAHAGGTFRMNGGGALEVQGAPTLGGNSNIQVSAGTLRFNATSGAATVGAGVQATVSGSATLELAGSVSALSQISAGRVDVIDNSTAVAGLHVTGSHQQVGGVDGSGTTTLEASSDLTANYIIQSALVIGGDATHPATVTIAASDSSGNPLAASDGFTLTNAPATASLVSAFDTLGSSSVSTTSLSPSLTALRSSAESVAGQAAVPEPAAIFLLGLGLAIIRLRCGFRRLPVADDLRA